MTSVFIYLKQMANLSFALMGFLELLVCFDILCFKDCVVLKLFLGHLKICKNSVFKGTKFIVQSVKFNEIISFWCSSCTNFLYFRLALLKANKRSNSSSPEELLNTFKKKMKTEK